MSKIVYNKLVRDKIPEIIEADGKKPCCRVLEKEELLPLLRKKLSEEVNEYLKSGEIEELADIAEVLHALSAQSGASWETVEQIRLKKASERGSFEKGILLESVETKEE